jgi:hypothetical protein
MPKHKLVISIGDDERESSLEGIPQEAWERFKVSAAKQFPQAEDGWATFLSEVIMACSGGDETVTYFMTDVPKENADAIGHLFGLAGYSWDRFHAYLLRAVVEPRRVRLINFNTEGRQEFGTVLVTGLDPSTFTRLEDATGVSFERVLASILLAAKDGTLEFRPETQFVESTDRP